MKKIITYLVLIFVFIGNLANAQQNGWVSITTPTSFILFDISFPLGQSDIGYAVGMSSTYNGDGVILKTTDAGNTWVEISTGTIPGLEAVCFTDVNTGYAGGWQNYFIKTTDGGVTWTTQIIDPGIWYFRDIEFWDTNNGVAATADPDIYVTSDAGATWTLATGLSQNIQAVTYADASTLFVVGGDEKISKSTDGGQTWSSIYTGTFQYMFMGVEFLNANYGMVMGEDGKVMITSDGGSNWTNTNAGGYGLMRGAHIFNTDSAYVCGTPEELYKTLNGGTNWNSVWTGSNAAFYEVKFTDDNIGFVCGSQGTMLKNEPPFTADFSASTDTVCVGNTVDFTDLSAGGPTSWSWTFEGGTPATSTDQNPTITYNTAGDFDVTLEVSDGTNTNTLLVVDMIHVMVAPVAPVTPTGSTVLCGGSTAEYTTESVAGAVSYYWEVVPSDAGTISGTDTIGTFNADDSWTGDYTVKVKSTNFCGWGPFSNTLSCTLNFNPYAFQLSEGGGYCSGSNGIEITQDGSETGVDYELFLDGTTTGIVIAGTGSSISFGYQTGQGIYTVTGTAGTCSEFMIGTPYIFVEFVPEQATTPEGPATVCQASTTEYSTESIFASDTIYWSLTPVESGIITGSGENISITWDTDFTGVASLTTQGYNDCGFGNESDPLEITVSAIPSPVVDGLTLVCDEEESDYSTPDNPGSTYLWTVTGGDIVNGSGTYQITVLWGDPGIGNVEVSETIGDSCTGTSEQVEVTIDDCTGLDEITSSEFNIYPNPAKDMLNINFSVDLNDKYTITIQNLLGQITSTLTGVGTGEHQLQSINTSGMPKGQYIISIVSTNGSYAHENFIVIN